MKKQLFLYAIGLVVVLAMTAPIGEINLPGQVDNQKLGNTTARVNHSEKLPVKGEASGLVILGKP